MKGEKKKVREAIAELDLVQKGDVGNLLATMKINDKFLSVVYGEVSPFDGFGVTAYYTKRLRRRLIAWKP